MNHSSALHAEQVVGIDLGTTFSVIARLDESGRPETLRNQEGDLITPSAVLFDGDDIVVGKEALKALTSEATNVADCPKRDIGRRYYNRPIAGRQLPPEVIEAYILKKLKDDAQRQIGPVRQAVITVPAYFDETRRQATQHAGYMAGFDVLDVLNEPTAAALAAGVEQGFLTPTGQSRSRQTLLVYDLGGGTFDVTLMAIEGNDFRVLATDGDVRLGGRDWDQRLVDLAAEAMLRQDGVDPRSDPINGDNFAGALWRECEDLKRSLSSRKKARIACELGGRSLSLEVTREQFEELTRDLLDRTEFTVRETLRAASCDWPSVNRILLVGGSTRMPQVAAMLKRISGIEPQFASSPDEAVAHGAALHAAHVRERLGGKAPRWTVANVNSHSLGVVGLDPKTRERQNVILIPKNTPLPASVKRIFRTERANQKSILVRLVEGESALPENCADVGQCQVRGLPRDFPAHSPVEITVGYAANGRLTVHVSAPGAGVKLEHEIERENMLTPEQIKEWRMIIAHEA